MQFDLIRLVLVSREQTSLFERKDVNGAVYSREEWLRTVFSQEIVFVHRHHEMIFKPQPATAESGGYLIAKLGRQISSVENEPPEKDFAEITRDAWRASIIIIDPTHHSDGQKLAFEANNDVGGALPIIKSLADHLNDDPRTSYIIEANPIVDPQTFWEFEEKNRGDITSISFELIAPNMVGIRDQLTRDMTGFRDNEKARKVKIGLQNTDGLSLNDTRVREMVDYTMEGGGSVKAAAKGRRKTYNSNNRGKRIQVENDKHVDSPSLSASIYDAITAIFGGDNE
jgi:hypothetical protein